MEHKKKIFGDLIWSILALGSMHGVLQIIVYPYLNKSVGAEQFGDILYVLAVLGIFAPSIGLAANNTRLIERKDITVKNIDLMLAMLPQLVVAAVVYIFLIGQYLFGVVDYLLALLVLGLTMLRNYGAVEYRLSLNYKGYFLYYLTISAGYLLGIALFPLTKNWILCFLLGELFGLLLLTKGHMHWPLGLSENWMRIFKRTLVLASSYLLYNTVLYLDRILLQNFMGSEVVSVYYVATLLGKTAALLVGPMNGVIIGHLTRNEQKINKKQFVKAGSLAVASGIILYLVILVVAPVFTRLFYPDISDAVLEIAWLANLSQILCFIASPLLTVMLTFCGAKWQLIIQGAYAAVFIAFSVIGVEVAALHGFIIAGLMANLARLSAVFLIGIIHTRSNGGNQRSG